MTQATLNSQLKQLATRDGFGQGLVEVAQRNQDIVGLCADLTHSVRMAEFEKKFTSRFIQVGVAEQNLVGTAAGLALGGKIPFAASYAVFNPGRSWEQIRVSVCYSNLNVKLVGSHAGLVTGPDGATHQALEDIALTRVLPNMTVVVPCDFEEARKATHAIAHYRGPCYLRLSRVDTPQITSSESPFEIGKAEVFRHGDDVTIIACGIMVAQALVAAHQLNDEGISARVINLHTIKPIDTPMIIDAANQTGAIVTAEDHQVQAGMGSAVAEELVKNMNHEITRSTPVEMVGVNDTFGESGLASDLVAKYKLSSVDIADAARRAISRKSE